MDVDHRLGGPLVILHHLLDEPLVHHNHMFSLLVDGAHLLGESLVSHVNMLGEP